MKECTLDPSLHDCPFLQEDMVCSNPDHCSFQIEYGAVRTREKPKKEKWYKKYYKNWDTPRE